VRAGNVLAGQPLTVIEVRSLNAVQETTDRIIGFWAVGHQQVTVLSRAYVAVVDHAEATDHNALEPNRLSVRNDPLEIRTSRFALGHGRRV
jgi:hypothetical protein